MDSTIEPNSSDFLKMNEPPTCEPTPQKEDVDLVERESQGSQRNVEAEWNGKKYDYMNRHLKPLIKGKLYDTRYKM